MNSFNLGDRVHIRESMRAPYSNETGTICGVEPAELANQYVVKFNDGLAFRYSATEMEAAAPVTSGTPVLQGDRYSR